MIAEVISSVTWEKSFHLYFPSVLPIQYSPSLVFPVPSMAGGNSAGLLGAGLGASPFI